MSLVAGVLRSASYFHLPVSYFPNALQTHKRTQCKRISKRIATALLGHAPPASHSEKNAWVLPERFQRAPPMGTVGNQYTLSFCNSRFSFFESFTVRWSCSLIRPFTRDPQHGEETSCDCNLALAAAGHGLRPCSDLCCPACTSGRNTCDKPAVFSSPEKLAESGKRRELRPRLALDDAALAKQI